MSNYRWVYYSLSTHNHTQAERDVITIVKGQHVCRSCDTPDGHAGLQAAAGPC